MTEANYNPQANIPFLTAQAESGEADFLKSYLDTLPVMTKALIVEQIRLKNAENRHLARKKRHLPLIEARFLPHPFLRGCFLISLSKKARGIQITLYEAVVSGPQTYSY